VQGVGKDGGHRFRRDIMVLGGRQSRRLGVKREKQQKGIREDGHSRSLIKQEKEGGGEAKELENQKHTERNEKPNMEEMKDVTCSQGVLSIPGG